MSNISPIADGDQGMTERQIDQLSRVYLALIEAHGLNIEAARNVIDRALKQAAAVLEIFGSAEAAARFEGNDTSARAKAAENRRLAARVAELESQLAAQGWRPVTEKPPEPPDGETSEYLTWNDFTGFTVRRYLDGQFRSVFRNPPTHWRPLPPAPQEPTR
jgi:hypothetical protein